MHPRGTTTEFKNYYDQLSSVDKQKYEEMASKMVSTTNFYDQKRIFNHIFPNRKMPIRLRLVRPVRPQGDPEVASTLVADSSYVSLSLDGARCKYTFHTIRVM